MSGGAVGTADSAAPADEDHRLSERTITGLGLLFSLGLAALPLVAGSHDSYTEAILGLVGFIAGYVLTMDVAGRVRTRRHEERVLKRLDAIEDARYGALAQLRALPELEEAVSDLADAVGEARGREVPFLANRAVEHFKRNLADALRVTQGRFKLPNRLAELRLLREALDDYRTARAGASIKAVAGLGLEHWRSPDFTEYFDACLGYGDALEQTRIFLVTRDEARDPAMIEILEKHVGVGVAVSAFALDKERLPDELCRPIMLFGNDLLMLHSRAVDGGFEVLFSDDPLDLEKAHRNFLSLIHRKNTDRSGSLVLWSPAKARKGGPSA